MGLKIERICDTTMTLEGVLDGMIPVTGNVAEGKIRIMIAGWIYEMTDDVISGAAALRYAVYSAIATYRNETNLSTPS